ncbi:hypothetical protein [Pseudomonas sp. MPDS]|uniref:hypothetical protein n=1 Tax=Pseudomonas sp. MPDS TaxID=2762896 RepID=UPI001566A1A8|nr:hypothetical protein [Pseudomonas sp. MPDS]QKJ35477.1 hypothetical protein HQ912_11865 [Pseudomonas sp. MPDS]
MEKTLFSPLLDFRFAILGIRSILSGCIGGCVVSCRQWIINWRILSVSYSQLLGLSADIYLHGPSFKFVMCKSLKYTEIKIGRGGYAGRQQSPVYARQYIRAD